MTESSLPPNHGKPWNPQDKSAIKELFLDGQSIDTIAESLGRTPTAIEIQLRNVWREDIRWVATGPGRLVTEAELIGDHAHSDPVVLTCPHGLPPNQCDMCRNRQNVYVTAGGAKYHRVRKCPHLAEGQEIVARRGGVTEEIVPVTRSRAEFDGYGPCRWCWSSSRSK